MAKIAQRSPEPRLPDPTVRTVLTLAIIVHLTALVVALSGYTEPSPLQSRLLQIFGSYINPLNFNVNHTYAGGSRWHLTHATNADTTFEVVIEAKNASGPPSSIRIPPDGIQPRIRRQRYQMLANAFGSSIGNNDIEGKLPLAVGAAFLGAEGGRQCTVVVRARMPTLREIYADDGSLVDPFNAEPTRAYATNVLAGPGQVPSLVPIPPAAEVAPATPTNKR